MTPDQLVRHGRKAETLLRDPLFVDAVEAVRLGIHALIETSDFSQDKEREDAYHMLRALKSVTGQLEKHIRAGKGETAQQAESTRSTVMRVAELKPEK